LENAVRTIYSAVLVSLVASAVAGCALNPFAEDNVYKRKNTEVTANEMKQPSASDLNASFNKADADKNGVISKPEAEKVPGLAAVFDKYNPDRDGTLDWNEFTAAMQSMNVSQK
jgi:Ca2+-binding EF-hand superfamily protein